MSDSTTKVITPKAMLSYPHLVTPQPGKNGAKAKYSAVLVFAPGTDIKTLQAAAVAAAEAKYPGKGAEMLRKGTLKSPFRRDVEDKYPEGSVYISARSTDQPGCVYSHAGPDGKLERMSLTQIKNDLYPGSFVRASIVAFTYDTDGNKGVSFALNNIQKLGDGDRIDGRKAAEDEFSADLSQAPADLAGLI